MNNKKAILLYTFLIILLFFAQLLFSLKSMNQMRYEELYESVRNVFWLDEHTVYDGTSSNIGWYGTLLLTYKIFGFEIHTAKYVRLAIHILLFCVPLTILLIRYLGRSLAWLPLLIIGLSPTLLYFNTLQTSYGMDLQYVPICILLALSINPDNRLTAMTLSAILGCISMIAAMTFPPFVLYLPFLGTLVFLNLSSEKATVKSVSAIAASMLLAFLLPLFTAFVYLKDFALLLKDPFSGDGIFRGGGGLVLDLANFRESLKVVVSDLFITGKSYYFELRGVEFSTTIAAISAIVIITGVLLLMIKYKSARVPLLVIMTLFITSIVFPNLSKGNPGIRRCTGIVLSFYVMLVFFIKFTIGGGIKSLKLKTAFIILCSVFLLHHSGVYYKNLKEISSTSLYKDSTWFAVKNTPRESLNYWVELSETSERVLYLKCFPGKRSAFPCIYSEIYPAISGYRRWNGMENARVFGYDWRIDKFIPLSIQLWESYYFPH